MAVPDSKLAAASSGDRDAFAQLVEPHLSDMLGAATWVLKDRDEAADVVQDALLDAWRSVNRLHSEDSFAAWFRKIVMRKAYKRARSRRELRLIPFERDSDETLDKALATRQLNRSISELDSDDRTIVILRYYLDLHVGEIAHIMSLREGTVKSRLHHAVRRLRAAFDAEGRR